MCNSKSKNKDKGIPYKYRPVKSFIGTGMTELEPSEDKPKLEGEIIFCHGYHSSPIHNEEGTLWNAPGKQNPDDPGYFTLKGENADEYDHTSQDDIYTDEELNEDIPLNKRQDDATIKEAIKDPGFLQFKFSDARQHWNYWNGISNKFKATEDYARYFNAAGREHYINGSHGMGSAANHRIDHGISLGYTWAEDQWNIFPRKTIEDNKENMPSVESLSPAYKPVTVVGHSQGCACAVGVVLGIMKYANELKWEEIPINIVLLGVHQNYGFPDDEYKYEEDVLWQKGKKYEIKNADFWDGYPTSPFFKEASNVKSLFNGLSHVFDVSNHRIGIDQHGEAITKKWSTIKARAVQFTFCNDRGDTVFRDGDIKTIASACNPQPNTSFLSAEFFKKGDPVNPKSKEYEQFAITPEQSGGFGGTLTIPCYAINKRIVFKDITELKDDDSWEENQIPADWTDYKTLAIEWAEAFDRFKYLKQEYEQKLDQRAKKITGYAKKQRYAPRPRISSVVLEAESALKEARREMIYKYGRVHEADLYAHFSPVSLINDGKALSDWGGPRTPGDSVGTNSSIWKRILAVKDKKLYKVNYSGEADAMKPKQKQQEEKSYIENDGVRLLIPTDIVNTDHINTIIDEHIKSPQPQSIWDHIKEWRYDRDWY